MKLFNKNKDSKKIKKVTLIILLIAILSFFIGSFIASKDFKEKNQIYSFLEKNS
ncbi:MAG: hypothetical protein ACRDD2_13660 [Sarcina sp.]